MTIQEAMEHAGSLTVTWSIRERLMQAMPKYMWFWRDEETKVKCGYCTACGNAMMLGNDLPKQDIYMEEYNNGFEGLRKQWDFEARMDGEVKHKHTGCCPMCGEMVELRSIGMSRKNMIDKRMVIQYRPSAAEPDALVCIGYQVAMPWHEMDNDTLALEAEIVPVELCVFRYGKGGTRFIRKRMWHSTQQRDGRWLMWDYWGDWERRKECRSGWSPGMCSYGKGGTPIVLDMESLEDAVADSVWETSVTCARDTTEANWYDRITMMDRIARYTCIEYLYKMGQDDLADAVVEGDTQGLINLRGKNAASVMRLTADEWAEVKGKKIHLTKDALWVHRLARQNGWKLNMELCAYDGSRYGYFERLKDLGKDHPEVDAVKAIKYCKNKAVRLNDYVDYVDMLKANGTDLRKEKAALKPCDFWEAHDREQARRITVRNKKQDEKIRKQIQKLEERYSFKACGIVMEPFASSAEIVTEGSRLNICIGNYVERYANGETILCKMRKEGEPGKPWHAVEFNKRGEMVQCRGYRNSTFSDEECWIRQFWEAWDRENGSKTNVQIRVEDRKEIKAA